MNHRAAKAIVQCLDDLIEARVQIAIIDATNAQNAHEARCHHFAEVDKAKARIVEWMKQPMTWKGVRK